MYSFLSSFIAVVLALSAMQAGAQEWSHQGILGEYDMAAIQRGYEVYRQVCSSCHAMKFLHFRNLLEVGLTKEQVTSIAASYKVQDGPDDVGDMFERPGRLSDKFIAPFANDNAARASNGGALPPDLSLIIKARSGHEQYVYDLLNGYTDPPEGVQKVAGRHYNKAFSSNWLAMSPPLTEGVVTYADDTTPDVHHMAHDVVSFLSWAAEPKMDQRKRMGLRVMFYLSLMALLVYFIKRLVWRKVDRGEEIIE